MEGVSVGYCTIQLRERYVVRTKKQDPRRRSRQSYIVIINLGAVVIVIAIRVAFWAIVVFVAAAAAGQRPHGLFLLGLVTFLEQTLRVATKGTIQMYCLRTLQGYP